MKTPFGQLAGNPKIAQISDNGIFDGLTPWYFTLSPHFSTHNPLQADACAWLGLSWKLKQTRRVTHHPSRGGGRCYDVWFSQEQLAEAQASNDVDVSKRSLCQWREQFDLGVNLLNLVFVLRA